MPRGRVPESGESRDNVYCLRLSESEVKSLDKARGAKKRSVFIRDAVLDASREK